MGLGVPYVVGNEPSQDAAERLAERGTDITDQNFVHGLFVDQAMRLNGYHGWTRPEVHKAMVKRWPHREESLYHGPSARCKKLMDLGLIKESGRKRVNPASGIEVGILVLGDGRHHLSSGELCANSNLQLSRRRKTTGGSMSLAKLETEILHAARRAFNNPRLRKKDLLEWSSGPLSPEDESETTLRLKESLNVWVTVPKIYDRRGVK